ncbi:hypothetical protein QAD02_010125 [Eretmocerus hayati]|uniref:Uncharacterized protein n=1 Tax=Eretmocerus hayati TaxID=131215 RepID=A0ACC2NBB2_9HYME|nr:hypothetical protein QAD02_010125 [Eretmocerus hayati]
MINKSDSGALYKESYTHSEEQKIQTSLSSTTFTVLSSTFASNRHGPNKPSSLKYGPDDPRNLLPNMCGLQGPLLPAPSIAGGIGTHPWANPWMAGLEYNTPKGKVIACGGSLITDRHVLTAGHCVNPGLGSGWLLISVRLGDWDIASEFDACSERGCKPRHIDVPVKREFRHELYFRNSTYLVNDIALLELEKTVRFTEEIQPICLPSKPYLPNLLTVIGWGITEYGLKSQTLLEATVPRVDKQECELVYKGFRFSGLNPNQICAGGEGNKDSCSGDSGGPLMGYNEIKIWGGEVEYSRAVMGIVSFGKRICGIAGFPAVYTKVYDYKPWILNKIRLSTNDANSWSFVTSISPDQIFDSNGEIHIRTGTVVEG